MQRVSLLPDRSTFNRETRDPNWPRGRVKKPTILDKINGKPRPPPPLTQIKDGKMARFYPSHCFILDLGLDLGGWGLAVPFYFVQDCSY